MPMADGRSLRLIQCLLVNVTVSRSPFRLLAFALLAVPAILLAVDMTISNKWISPPETTAVVVGQTTGESGEQVDVTEDVLTDVGRAERRRDILFGGGLFLGGVVAMGWALKELASPTRFLVADIEGLLIRVDGIRRPARRFSWSEIAEVRSGLADDDGIETPVLSIRMHDPDAVPPVPAGGFAEPPWLHLYSEEWDRPAHQVATQLEQSVSRRPADGDQ